METTNRKPDLDVTPNCDRCGKPIATPAEARVLSRGIIHRDACPADEPEVPTRFTCHHCGFSARTRDGYMRDEGKLFHPACYRRRSEPVEPAECAYCGKPFARPIERLPLIDGRVIHRGGCPADERFRVYVTHSIHRNLDPGAQAPIHDMTVQIAEVDSLREAKRLASKLAALTDHGTAAILITDGDAGIVERLVATGGLSETERRLMAGD